MANNTTNKASERPARKPPAKAAEKARAPMRRGVGAIICLFLSIFSFIGYFEVSAWFIDFFCGCTKGLVGWGYYIFPPALLLSAVILTLHKGRPVRLRVFCAMLLPVIFGAIAHLGFARDYIYIFEPGVVAVLFEDGRDMLCGGLLSGALAILSENLFSVYGAMPVLLFIFVILLMASLRISPREFGSRFKNRKRAPAYEQPPPTPGKDEGGQKTIEPPAPQPRHLLPGRRRNDIELPADAEGGKEQLEESNGFFKKNRGGLFDPNPRVRTPDQLLATEVKQEPPEETFVPDIKPEEITAAAERNELENWDLLEISDPPKPKEPEPPALLPDDDGDEDGDGASIEALISEAPGEYEFPPLTLLKSGANNVADGRDEIAANRERLAATLKSFGVPVTIAGAVRGPTVTRYDIELEAGVKLNKILNLSGDIALSLGVANVRIAPIPDKISTVGVEVPNRIISTVYLRDIIESAEFKAAQSKLSFAIGKDISGACIVGNISRLPHLLIAGTTGSGKSVCINSLIISLLYKSTPQEVRLIMIDPKMVELGVYNGIPHLYIPVVTDPKKAAGALQWSVVEMLKRYRLFSEAGVRDITGYNAYMSRQGEPVLPQVVIVIDELADLMLVASKEVEESICRVAQMGRASGMHLVIATQRPSADIITGLMKANIPSRIAFAVSSAMESRIILDAQGAERLIGAGDMLYSPIGLGKPVRIQGAYVTDEEREDIINFVKTSGGGAEYSEEIMEQIERAAEPKAPVEPGDGDGDYDEMLPQAVDVIFETKQASVSMLQRRLKLGYARAARIVDQMEELGVVGEFEGSKPRQILMTREQWLGGKGSAYGGGAAPFGADDYSEAGYPPFDLEDDDAGEDADDYS